MVLTSYVLFFYSVHKRHDLDLLCRFLSVLGVRFFTCVFQMCISEAGSATHLIGSSNLDTLLRSILVARLSSTP